MFNSGVHRSNYPRKKKKKSSVQIRFMNFVNITQIWAWERLPFIRPGRLSPRPQPPPDVVDGDHPLPSAPYGSRYSFRFHKLKCSCAAKIKLYDELLIDNRWNVGFKLETVGTHVLVLYRDQLDNMKDDQVIIYMYLYID